MADPRLSPDPAAGFTRLGFIVILTVTSVMALTLLPLFVSPGDYSPVEVRTILSTAAQGAVNRVQSRLSGARVFGRDENAFLDRVELSSAPAALAGSRLPDPAAGGAETTRPAAGNCLFLTGDWALPPLSELMDGSGAPASLPMRGWIFTYFYLAPTPGRAVAGLPARDLWEWHSTPYADYRALAAVADATLRGNAVEALLRGGISGAFDAAAPGPSTAFYKLSPAPPWILPDPGHRIAQAGTAACLTESRVGTGTFLSSVSPNTGGVFAPPVPVPARAAADGDFPSGFETALSPDRRVSARLVMVAWGNFKGYGSCEKTVSAAGRGPEAAPPAR